MNHTEPRNDIPDTHARRFTAAGVFLEVSGLAMVVGALIPGLMEAIVGYLFVPAIDVALGPVSRLTIGVGGAVLTGWGAAMTMLGRELPVVDASSVGRAFAAGALAWFALDGMVSIAVGAYLNLVGNTIYLAAMLIPSLALARTGVRAPVARAA